MRVKVKPAIPGQIIRDPHTKRVLPDDGAEMPGTSFWIRRLRDGDVVLVTDAPMSAPPAPLEDRMVHTSTKRRNEDK